MQIYIHRDGQQFGPYSIEQTEAYLATGNLLSDDLAWHEGAADWAPLSQIAGLTPTAPSSTPATPGESSSRAWIPARRTDAPSSLASSPAPASTPIPQSTPARQPAQPTPVDPDFEPPTKSRSSRKSSSRSNPFVRQKRAAALRNMGIGGFIALVGTVITVGTYESATSDPHGGGHYVIAWGAIVFGAIRFLTGCVQFLEAK